VSLALSAQQYIRAAGGQVENERPCAVGGCGALHRHLVVQPSLAMQEDAAVSRQLSSLLDEPFQRCDRGSQCKLKLLDEGNRWICRATAAARGGKAGKSDWDMDKIAAARPVEHRAQLEDAVVLPAASFQKRSQSLALNGKHLNLGTARSARHDTKLHRWGRARNMPATARAAAKATVGAAAGAAAGAAGPPQAAFEVV